MIYLKQKLGDINSFVPLSSIEYSKLCLRTSNKNLMHDVYQPAGVEHYRLLCLLSQWFANSVIYEIGTWLGAGTICLAYNKNNRVVSYDIEYNVDVKRLDNMEFRIGDYKNDKELLNSPFIFVDVNHEGTIEREIYEYLISNKYKGFTLWNSINLNLAMRNFWTTVAMEKYDLTRYGHYSGTGVVFFE